MQVIEVRRAGQGVSAALRAAQVLSSPRRVAQGFSPALGAALILLTLTVAHAQTHLPDVRFVPTPHETVDVMLDAAKVTSADIVYDLGCGDGRIVIAAAKKYGARGVGIDIVAERIAEANANARAEGVSHLVRFIQADVLTTDFSDATVVALYMSPSINEKLKPRLLKLRPGARVVSYVYDMIGWIPDARLDVDGRWVFLWTVRQSKPYVGASLQAGPPRARAARSQARL